MEHCPADRDAIDIVEARSIFGQLASRIEEPVQEVLGSVVRSAWAHRDSEWDDPDPVVRDQYPERREPTGVLGRRYGFDELDCLRIAEDAQRDAQDEWEPWSQSVWVLEGGRAVQCLRTIERSGSHSVASLRRIKVPAVVDGRLSSVATYYADDRFSTITYDYDVDSRVVSTREVWLLASGDPSVQYLSEYTYDEHGLTTEHRTRIDVDGDPLSGREVAYRRKLPGALQKAKRLVVAELPDRVRSWAERVGSRGDAYCLILGYDITNPSAPPTLGLGTYSDLPASLVDADLEIWSAPDFRHFAVDAPEFVQDEAFRDACKSLTDEWLATDDENEPRRLLQRCAKKLREQDWTGIARDEDFLILVLDSELETLEASLHEAADADAPSRILARLTEGLNPR